MKQFIIKLFVFISIPIITYVPFSFFVLPILLENVLGPNTEKQINYSFENLLIRDFEMLILGNSRLYRGLNPDLFSAKTYNFAHDNETYNQIFYKLKYLYDNEKEIEFLILGVDYFQFEIFSDTRNFAYGPYLGEDYLNDYPSKFYRIENYLSLLKPKRFLHLFTTKEVSFLKDNGQYIRDGIAKKNNSGTRSTERKIIQIKYFEKILKFSKKNNIKVFLIMPPTRFEELKLYKPNEINEFDEFLKKYENENVVFLDFSTDNAFDLDDFTDLTHLNEAAANRFSEKLNDSIELIKKKRQ